MLIEETWVSIDGRVLTGWSKRCPGEMAECRREGIDQLLGREAKGGRGRRGGGGREEVDLKVELIDEDKLSLVTQKALTRIWRMYVWNSRGEVGCLYA